MALVEKHAPALGVRASCDALGLPRSTFYRKREPFYGPKEKRPSPPRRIPDEERKVILNVLNEDRFADHAPAEVQATLLEEGKYHCSVRTMHRILAENIVVRERRNQLKHTAYVAPELLATKPNELWSWDITKLRGPTKWTYYYLYVILDVYSRCVVGWMVADRERAELANKLIADSFVRQRLDEGQLTLHADNGASMKSKCVAFLLADLGVTKSHSRPHVSDDNPFSEAQFKTMKYRPDFPERFGSLEDARSHCVDFFDWYNHEHHHSGLEMLTPADVHYGLADLRVAEKQKVLDEAYRTHPERFPGGPPKARKLKREVWINKPKPAAAPDEEGAPDDREPSLHEEHDQSAQNQKSAA